METITQLLTKEQTLQKIRRIAHEIHEQNFREEEIVFAGIYEKGYKFAELLIQEFNKLVKKTKSSLVKIDLDKRAPLQSKITLDCEDAFLEGKSIILIDDVLSSGRTLAYSLKPFLNIEIKKLQIAVIVNRNQPNFPIHADFEGYSLSTTLQENISVELFDEDKFGVYIN